MKNALLKFVVEKFREDLRKMPGLSLVGVKLTWTGDSERFLREREKRGKILIDEVVKEYKFQEEIP